MRVGLDDGTTICASHIVAADGKWSVVRAAFFEDWCAPPSWMLYLLWRYSLWRYSLRRYSLRLYSLWLCLLWRYSLWRYLLWRYSLWRYSL